MAVKEKTHSDITLSRLVATALAAITAAFLGSRLGVAGTVVGAGVASMVSTLAGALYQRSLDRTSQRVRSRVVPDRRAGNRNQNRAISHRRTSHVGCGGGWPSR